MKDSIVTTRREGQVAVASLPHPFMVEAKAFEVPYGTNLTEILRIAQPNERLRQYAVIEVNGYTIPSEWWPYYCPKKAVGIRVLPQGGDKDPLRTVLLLAVAVAGGAIAGGAFQGGSLAASTGFTFAANSASALALAAATTLVGRMLVDAIAPPPSLPDGRSIKDASSIFSINGARNRLTPYAPIPRVYGRILMTPPYAAKPFTEIRGNNQFFYGLFLWGYGPVDVERLRIGDTPLGNFEDVRVSHNLDGTGWTNGNLFNKSVDEDALDILIDNAGGWQQRTTSDVADEISVDILFPKGLGQINDKGKRISRTVVVEVQAAEAGTGNWFGTQTAVGAQSGIPYNRPNQRPTRGGSAHISVQGRVVINKATGTAEVLMHDHWVFFSQPPIPPTPEWAYSIATLEISSDGTTTITNQGDQTGKHSGFNVSNGTGNTVDITAGTIEATQFVQTRRKLEPFRLSTAIKTPDPTKQYDVRLRRTTADTNDNQIFDEVRWTAIRATQFENPVTRTDVGLTAIRVRATDQLNGVIDEFNGVVQALLPEYDTVGDAWNNDAEALSPSAAYRDVLTGTATERALALSRLELPDLEHWAEFCFTKGFRFNHIFDKQVSVAEALDTIASAGRAAKSLRDGKWTVVIDEPKTTIRQHFTPRNIINYEGEKAFRAKTHAIRAQFLNEDADWQVDELIVYNDGFTADGNAPTETPPFPDDQGGYSVATRFEEVEFPGSTSEAEVHKASRYHLAVDELRPERHTLTVGIEHLRIQRGDMFRATHDVPQWGTGYGRIKSISLDGSGDVDQFILDSEVTLETGNDYVARFRLSDGTDLLEDLVDPGSNVSTDTFTPTTPISAPQPQVGDIVMIGISTLESVELIAKSILPNDDWEAAIVAVDAAPGVHNAADENIPTFDPRITNVSQWSPVKPPIPVVIGIQSDESVLVQGPGGDLIAQIVVTLSVGSDTGESAQFFQARYRETPEQEDTDNLTVDEEWAMISSPTKDGLIRMPGVRELVDYDVDVRTTNGLGITSDWVTAASAHTVIGKTSPPPDVAEFSAQQVRELVTFKWSQVLIPDLAGYEIRYDGKGVLVWDNAIVVTSVTKGTLVTNAAIPPGDWTVGIKAFDTSGNQSVNEITSDITVTNEFDIIDSTIEDPRWVGTIEDDPANAGVPSSVVHDVSGRLVPNSLSDASGDNFDIFDTFVLDPVTEMRYTAREIDIGFDNAVRSWHELSAALGPGEAGSVDSSFFLAYAPDGEAYGAFEPWAGGTTTARRFKGQARIPTDGGVGYLGKFKVTADTLERSERHDDFSVAIGGTTLTYDKEFHNPPNVEVTSGTSGAFPFYSNKTTTSVDIELFDSAANSVAGTVDVKLLGA